MTTNLRINRGWRGHVSDAVALRALRVESDLQPEVWYGAGCKSDRRTGRYGRAVRSGARYRNVFQVRGIFRLCHDARDPASAAPLHRRAYLEAHPVERNGEGFFLEGACGGVCKAVRSGGDSSRRSEGVAKPNRRCYI